MESKLDESEILVNSLPQYLLKIPTLNVVILLTWGWHQIMINESTINKLVVHIIKIEYQRVKLAFDKTKHKIVIQAALNNESQSTSLDVNFVGILDEGLKRCFSIKVSLCIESFDLFGRYLCFCVFIYKKEKNS